MFDNAIEQLDFVIYSLWVGEASCAIQVETRQVTVDGSERTCSQVFVVEMDDGHVTR